MLEDLDTIDWASVQHAYGEATDTPGSLRMLLDADPARREPAYKSLCITLLEDGFRNEATPVVVPFLVELIADPTTPERARLLEMLACAVAGVFTIGSPPIVDDGATDVHPVLRDIYRAAEPAVSHSHELVLREGDDRLCIAAVYFLAAMWRSADATVPVLHERLARSADARVRAVIAFALGHLRLDDPALLNLHADDPDPAVRVLAAVALLRRPSPPASALDTIITALADPDGVPGLDRLPCVEMGVSDLGAALCFVPPAVGAPAVPALCAALRRASDFETLTFAEPLLHFTFGGSAPPGDPAALTDAQRQALTAILETPSFWTVGHRDTLLRAFGLPTSRTALAAVLGPPAT